MIQRLRRKFIIMNLSVITVILIGILCTIIYSTQHNLARSDYDLMRRLALNPPQNMLPDSRPPEDLHQSYLMLRMDTQGTQTSEENVHFPYTEEADKTALMAAADEHNKTISSDEWRSAPNQTDVTLTGGVLYDYDRHVRFLKAVHPDFGSTYVFLDISGSQAMLASLARNCLIIGILAFAIFFILSVLFARWAVHPVEAAWKDQKQFISDASHELKTPLTVILTNAQLLGSPDFTETEKSHFSENILHTAEQMRTLVESLLDLSRADRGVMQNDAVCLNFSELLTQQLCLYEPVYFEHGLTLEQSLADDVQILGSDTQIRQVVDILLDNAGKYAAAPSTVLVTLKKQHHSCLLSVTNAGEPIPADELQAIFKRFYRTDKARSAPGSYGLGLSIADTIVRAHHGLIWAESSAQGNTFFVRLPLVSAAGNK